MDRLTAGLGIRPLAELLSEPAVVRHRPLAVGQALRIHARLHLRVHRLDVDVAPREQIGERFALRRRLGMEREVHPLDLHVVLRLQPLNTHGTEIAPGSDVVGEDPERDGLRHRILLCAPAMAGQRLDVPARSVWMRHCTPGVRAGARGRQRWSSVVSELAKAGITSWAKRRSEAEPPALLTGARTRRRRRGAPGAWRRSSSGVP